MCDRLGAFRERGRDEGIGRETGDDGRWFVACEPVEKGGEGSQRVKDQGGVARVVEVAEHQREIIERGQRVAVLGL